VGDPTPLLSCYKPGRDRSPQEARSGMASTADIWTPHAAAEPPAPFLSLPVHRASGPLRGDRGEGIKGAPRTGRTYVLTIGAKGTVSRNSVSENARGSRRSKRALQGAGMSARGGGRERKGFLQSDAAATCGAIRTGTRKPQGDSTRRCGSAIASLRHGLGPTDPRRMGPRRLPYPRPRGIGRSMLDRYGASERSTASATSAARAIGRDRL